MQKKLRVLAACTALLGGASTANAVDEDLGIYGFLSVGVAVLDNKNEVNDFGVTFKNYDDEQGNFKQETVFGLQINKQINDRTSATGQIVSRGDSNYQSESTWAFVSFAATDDLDIRMGRLRLPLFYYSEFLEVGYAYNWVRTPYNVYSIPFSSFDGVDLTQRFNIGDVNTSLKLNYGRVNETMNVYGDDYLVDLRNVLGVSLDFNYGDFGLRLGVEQTDVEFDLVAEEFSERALDRVLFGAQKAAPLYGLSADEFDIDGQKVRFYDVAATYNNGDIGLVAEMNLIEYDSPMMLDNSGWLVSASKRFSDTTFHLTYANLKDSLDSGNVGKLQEAIATDVSDITGGDIAEDTSIILGARYDYDAGTAIKFEIERQKEKYHQNVDGNSAMLYSVAVDLIF